MPVAAQGAGVQRLRRPEFRFLFGCAPHIGDLSGSPGQDGLREQPAADPLCVGRCHLPWPVPVQVGRPEGAKATRLG